MKRDWNTDNTWTWHTSSIDTGDTDISVWIRDGHHAPPDNYDLEKVYYDYAITGSAPSLAAEWHFDEGSGSTVKDNTGSAEINA